MEPDLHSIYIDVIQNQFNIFRFIIFDNVIERIYTKIHALSTIYYQNAEYKLSSPNKL